MKVLAIVAGRRGQVGEFIAKTALKGAEAEGAEIELINLRNLKLAPCTECNACQDPPHAWVGQCVVKDDFIWLDNKILDADAIIVVMPAYEKTIPSEFKILMDRTGPNHDVTIRKNFYEMRKARGIEDGRSIDTRSFKKRPVAFIAHGGTDWASLSLPTMKLWAIPMGFDIVDEVYFPWNIMLRVDDERLKRAYDAGAQVAKAARDGVADYIGTPGICPCCHSRTFTLTEDGKAECVVCSIVGTPTMINGKLSITFTADEMEKCLLSDTGRKHHLDDMLQNGSKLRNMDMTELNRRNDEMLKWLQPSRPERK